MGFNPGKDNLTGLEVDSDEDIKLDSATGNIIFQDSGTDIVTLDMDTVATQAVFTHNIDNDNALLCFKQADGIASAGSLDGQGYGGWFYKRFVRMDLDENLSIATMSAALSYSGAVIGLKQDGAHVITLPTTTDAGEAKQILGMHFRFVLSTAGTGTDNITIVRGDATNDEIFGVVASAAADSGAAAGITVNSNVVSFVDNVAVAGDYADVVCISATAAKIRWAVSGMAST